MEDPAKRKERLQAMRTEATQINASAETTMNPGPLSNPLAETSGTLPSQEESFQTQRFDYYTDPMSAYSSNKRNKTDQQRELGSPVSQFPPGPMGSAYRAHNIHGGFQAEGRYDIGSPHIEPRGMANPSPLYHGAPHEGWNNFRPPAHNFRPFQSPRPVPGPFPNYLGNPDPGNTFGGRGNHNRPVNPGCYAPPCPSYGQRNANWAGRTGPGSGRGGGGRNMNSNFGRNGGRGQKYDHAGYQTPGPERFYDRSMTEDPWKYLEPVLWKSCADATTSSFSTGKSWLPKSIAPKNSTTAPETSNKPSNARQSLAEFLAASLDEATSDEPNK